MIRIRSEISPAVIPIQADNVIKLVNLDIISSRTDQQIEVTILIKIYEGPACALKTFVLNE